MQKIKVHFYSAYQLLWYKRYCGKVFLFNVSL